jgi:hypothetical protein
VPGPDASCWQTATLSDPFGGGGGTDSVAFSPDGATLAVVDNGDHAYLCPGSEVRLGY